MAADERLASLPKVGASAPGLFAHWSHQEPCDNYHIGIGKIIHHARVQPCVPVIHADTQDLQTPVIARVLREANGHWTWTQAKAWQVLCIK